MTKEAKIKKFKFAFLKPEATSEEVKKAKTKLEKLMKTASKKMSFEQREAESEFGVLMKQITDKDEEYGKKLLGYKLTKHWDDPKEFNIWAKTAPSEDDVVNFVEKVMGDNPSDKQISQCFFHVPTVDRITKQCWDKAQDRILQDGVAYFEKHKTQPPGDLAPFQSKVALELVKKGQMLKIPTTMDSFLQPDDIREMAKIDPAGYAKRFVENANPFTKLQLLKDPEVRNAISKDPVTWKKLKGDAPVLELLDSVKSKVENRNLSKEEVLTETAKAVFKELLADDGCLNLTYYTNKFTSPSEVMCSSKEAQQKIIDQNRSGGDTETMPDQPAMQCDELVTVLKYAMEAALGSNSGVECKHIVIKSMVLTQPINTLPGGLLKNTFGGNVYNDSNSLTKQVLFSGNDFGDTPDAHTYLNVGGMLYDAVLGTKGKAVTDAVAEEFGNWVQDKWVTKTEPKTPVWVAKSKSTGNYVIKEPGLEAAANTNGFSTAYRLTTDLGKYVEPVK